MAKLLLVILSFLCTTIISCVPAEHQPDNGPAQTENIPSGIQPGQDTGNSNTGHKPPAANTETINTQASQDTAPVRPDNATPPVVAQDLRIYNATTDDLIGSLERRLLEFPKSETVRKELAVLYWLDRQYEKSKELLATLDLSKENPGYKMLLSSDASELGDNAEAMALLDELRRDWKNKYPLKLGTPVFCSFISGYDLYTPVDRPIFSPGQGVPVYCTLDNFFCEKQKNGKVPLNLKVETELSTAGDNPIVIELDQTSWDINREYNGFVNDVYVAFTFIIPRSLVPGPYVLKVSVTNTGPEGETKKDEKNAGFTVR